jgi:hypothetical protein
MFTCHICFYRIHDGQPSAWMRKGESNKFVPVHQHHHQEGKIIVYQNSYNVIEEYVEWRAIPA